MKNNNFIDALHHIISNDNFSELYNDMSKYQKQIFNNMKRDSSFLENYSL